VSTVDQPAAFPANCAVAAQFRPAARHPAIWFTSGRGSRATRYCDVHGGAYSRHRLPIEPSSPTCRFRSGRQLIEPASAHRPAALISSDRSSHQLSSGMFHRRMPRPWGQSGDRKQSKWTGRGRTRPKQNEVDLVSEAARCEKDAAQVVASERLHKTAWIGLKIPRGRPRAGSSPASGTSSFPRTYDPAEDAG